GDFSIEEISTKTVQICTTENKNNYFIVVLICFANGQKLSFMIIFKSQKWPKTKPSSYPYIIVSFYKKD
ncbi:6385_t:CDS:1, partial [Cetraspora pellucida]